MSNHALFTTVLRPADPVDFPPSQELVRLPLSGRVACGLPIPVFERPVDHVEVPASLLARAHIGLHYALRVTGESMHDLGIVEDDLVIIRSQNTARPGQIVVALVQGEATLKKYFPAKNHVELRPCNHLFASIHAPHDQVLIQGVMVGLWREA